MQKRILSVDEIEKGYCQMPKMMQGKGYMLLSDNNANSTFVRIDLVKTI
ncbi:hypothetical protein LQZ18_15280 [Lachnospiraceae bacterium ZAX-1]